MNIHQRALGNETEEDNNDCPTYKILDNPFNTRSKISCYEKNNPPSSMVVGDSNDCPTYKILHNPTSTSSEISCYEKNNAPSSMVVGDIDKGSSDNLENVYDGIQNVKTTGSDNVGDDDAVKNLEGTLSLRFIEK